MTLRHLKVYLAVYRTENITKAAQMLSMTQPAVTRTIHEIENYYGIRLFERLNRRLKVTQTGEAFYHYALHIVDSFEQMELGMRNWDELGVLRVGCSITLGNSLLPQVLTEFHRVHPALQIRSTISNGASIQQAILDNQLDFAVLEGGVQHEQLCSEVIGADHLVLILPPEDPRRLRQDLCLEDVAFDPLLLREEGSTGRKMISYAFERRGFSVRPAMESVSTQALTRAVHAGLGIAFLPEQMVKAAVASGFVASAQLTDEHFCRKNYLVWHRQKFLTKSARELMGCFRKAAET